MEPRLSSIRGFACFLAGATLLTAAAAPAPAEEPTPPRPQTVVIGPRYAAGGVHRFLWGDDYRDLWTTPIEVEVLDLHAFEGGLKVLRRVGGQETKGLALKGPDGRDWTFRGIDKDPRNIVPADLRGTIAEDIVQDQIAASHPMGPLMADVFLEAAGVLHAPHRLVVMPDDPALGEFQKDFAGVVGTIEPFPGTVVAGDPNFGGATEFIGHKDLYKRIENGEEQADVRALLRARLVDVLIGDWDRHREQWHWAKLPGNPLWQPIPEDRDLAFSDFEGFIAWNARPLQPRFVKFEAEYPSILGLTLNGGSEQDRVLLPALEKSAWREIGADLKARITDEVIEKAARRMPPPYYQKNGPRLIRALRARRDQLPGEAETFYRFLARQVDVQGTNKPELAEIQRLDNGDLDVKLSWLGADGQASAPYFHRLFHPEETSEVRVYLKGGDDRVVVTGHQGGILLRVVGGAGNDVLDDSKGGGTRFYDDKGSNRVIAGPGTHFDDTPYVAPVPDKDAPWVPPRDWGHEARGYGWGGYGTDAGLYLGAGVVFRSFGFRKNPEASTHTIRAGYSTSAKALFDYAAEFRHENSGVTTNLRIFANGLNTLRFFGYGNETKEVVGEAFYKVSQYRYAIMPSLAWPLARGLKLSAGPILKYNTTNHNEDVFINQAQPYGVENFGEIGGGAGLTLDNRKGPGSGEGSAGPVIAVRNYKSGVFFEAAGAYYPSWWGVKEKFGEVHGTASAYLSAGGYFQPTLAVRAGGKRVWGTYPFEEAAYIGGSTTVRGLAPNRYAGDAALYGTAELRFRFFDVFPRSLAGQVGLIGLVDSGRVYLDGESSKSWHTGYGGGLWIGLLNNTVLGSVTVARAERHTGVYVRFGQAF